MRISTQRDDPGFRTDTCRYRVFLDDYELHSCVTADEELGMVLCMSHGYPWAQVIGLEFMTKTNHGKVRIVRKPDEI